MPLHVSASRSKKRRLKSKRGDGTAPKAARARSWGKSSGRPRSIARRNGCGLRADPPRAIPATPTPPRPLGAARALSTLAPTAVRRSTCPTRRRPQEEESRRARANWKRSINTVRRRRPARSPRGARAEPPVSPAGHRFDSVEEDHRREGRGVRGTASPPRRATLAEGSAAPSSAAIRARTVASKRLLSHRCLHLSRRAVKSKSPPKVGLMRSREASVIAPCDTARGTCACMPSSPSSSSRRPRPPSSSRTPWSSSSPSSS